MSKIDYKDQQNLNSLISEEFCDWSEPLTITQEMIDSFAELSGDNLWIHTDPARCAEESPFKSTIAHGFLVLSLLSKMPIDEDVTQKIGGYSQIMNYGSDKLRFLQPVLVDSEIHARNRVMAVVVSDHKTVVTLENQIQMVNSDKPSLLYQLSLVLM